MIPFIKGWWASFQFCGPFAQPQPRQCTRSKHSPLRDSPSRCRGIRSCWVWSVDIALPPTRLTCPNESLGLKFMSIQSRSDARKLELNREHRMPCGRVDCKTLSLQLRPTAAFVRDTLCFLLTGSKLVSHPRMVFSLVAYYSDALFASANLACSWVAS